MKNHPISLFVRNVFKTYANVMQALYNVSLHLLPGMYGLLGTDCAGKTTMMNTLATLQEPDKGNIILGETAIVKQKEKINV